MSKKERDDFQRGRESMHSEMEALRAENEALAARVEALQSWYDDHTERECAICPEDVSCTEYIDLLLDTVEASTAKNDALAASLGRVWALATHDSECDSRVGGKCNCPYYSTPAADLKAHDARVRREALSRACDRLRPMISGLRPEAALALLEAVLGPESQSNEQETK